MGYKDTFSLTAGYHENDTPESLPRKQGHHAHKASTAIFFPVSESARPERYCTFSSLSLY